MYIVPCQNRTIFITRENEIEICPEMLVDNSDFLSNNKDGM